MSEKVFTDKNISSIGGKGPRNSEKNLELIKNELARNAKALSRFMDATGLNAENISSMLNTAGVKVATGIGALLAHQSDFVAIIKTDKTFEPEHISSMLSGAGPKLEIAIEALAKHHGKLKEIITKDKTFKASDLASMLSSAGAHIEKPILDIYNRRDELKALCTKMGGAKIVAAKLHGKAIKGLDVLIDNLYTSWVPKSERITHIPADSGIDIASQSPATEQQQKVQL